ncbi:hypothetical protein [Sphingomonas mesophila]|uniref:hypothetical protein n=1 Tax=Sphingomonas mesophila TaxID=2303576 RepID=UPI000E5748D1|nr:hypothetical protein [Sphingomonas mesophila]
MTRSAGRLVNRGLLAAGLLFGSPLFAPQLLAFPHHARSGDLSVYSEVPIDRAALDAVARRSAALVAASPLARSSEPRRVFLTSGGWRWRWLAVRFPYSFAVSRPFTEPLIFNRSSIARDWVHAGGTTVRSLSGTIAHETCHGMIRREFGLSADWTKPMWLREGYCDFVADESALDQARADEMRRTDPGHRSLAYYDGRRRVAAELARNGGDVRALFAAY